MRRFFAVNGYLIKLSSIVAIGDLEENFAVGASYYIYTPGDVLRVQCSDINEDAQRDFAQQRAALINAWMGINEHET